MKKLTVTLPEPVLDRLRILAAQKKVSVNRFVREVLTETTGETDVDTEWRAGHKALLEEIGPRARVGEWNREEIYAERIG